MARSNYPKWPQFPADGGLLPAIAQDEETGRVLMLAWMNEESLRETIETGRAVYFSRSRGRRWLKGETSGHFQELRSIHWDCDGDAILLKVKQIGAACHFGFESCFFTTWTDDGAQVEEEPCFEITSQRRESDDDESTGKL